MHCTKCGKDILNHSMFCPNCGTKLNAEVKTLTAQQHSSISNEADDNDFCGISCPWCGSKRIQAISETHSDGVDFCKICCCGFLGLWGAGKTETEHYWVCQNCGKKFKI